MPPEDPEDWTRPLTWVAAIGMLAAPAVAIGWYVLGAPLDSSRPLIGTWAVAMTLAVGAAAAGGTQLGWLRALTGTLGAALLAALFVVGAGVMSAGERQLGAASPTLAHSVAAALAGVAGAAVGAGVAGASAGRLSRPWRGIASGAAAIVTTALVLPALFLG